MFAKHIKKGEISLKQKLKSMLDEAVVEYRIALELNLIYHHV